MSSALITKSQILDLSDEGHLPYNANAIHKIRIRVSSTERLLFLISFTAVLWSVGYPDVFRFPIYLWIVPIAAMFHQWRTSLIVSLFKTYLWILLLGLVLLIIYNWRSVLWTISLIAWIFTVYKFLVFRLRFARQQRRYLLTAFDDGLVWGLRANLLAILLSFGYQCGLLHTRCGFFIEPSHLGYTLGPVIAYLSFKKSYRLEAVVSAAVLCLFTPSSTFAISIGIGLLLGLCSPFIVLIILGSAIGATAIIGFITLSTFMLEVKPESTAVLIAAFNTASDQMNISPILGNGPFSWVQGGERDIDYKDFSTLNQRDLASLLPFVMASFGWTGVIMLIFVLILLLRRARVNNGLDLLIMICILTFFARWAGPVPSAFLPLLAVCLAFKRIST
jgi:hypothetical protein